MNATLKSPTDFQSVIFVLQQFWAKKGCAILQPLDCAVGAGTFHPATFLRALGPKPWRAAYVQPCRRPQDGRYRDISNRLQRYYQFQVVMKPSPDEFQELFLDSLAALGIQFGENDIRFVEDDWESPSLGAWGLGWEVWLNGMEVAQFTYFQEMGGMPCRPVMGEITYGLERLAMHLQKKSKAFDLIWTDKLTYGEVDNDNEGQQSEDNFDASNSELMIRLFDDSEKEVRILLKEEEPQGDRIVKEKLPLAAYESFLICSHLFNQLDARGVISVTERANYIGRLRAMTRGIAKSYLERTADLES